MVRSHNVSVVVRVVVGVLRAPLKEKELLFAIPTSFLLTSELDHWVEQFTAAASDSTSNIHVPSPRSPAVSHFASLGDSDRLLLRLLEEYGRGRSSRWFHYIALLPDDVGALVLHWCFFVSFRLSTSQHLR